MFKWDTSDNRNNSIRLGSLLVFLILPCSSYGSAGSNPSEKATQESAVSSKAAFVLMQ